MDFPREDRRKDEKGEKETNAASNNSSNSEISMEGESSLEKPTSIRVYTRRTKNPTIPEGVKAALAGDGASRSKGKEIATDQYFSRDPLKWFKFRFEDVNPMTFVGLRCKVFWDEDAEWYHGYVGSYNHRSKKHRVDYDDGDVEKLILSNERIRFDIPDDEKESLQCLVIK